MKLKLMLQYCILIQKYPKLWKNVIQRTICLYIMFASMQLKGTKRYGPKKNSRKMQTKILIKFFCNPILKYRASVIIKTQFTSLKRRVGCWFEIQLWDSDSATTNLRQRIHLIPVTLSLSTWVIKIIAQINKKWQWMQYNHIELNKNMRFLQTNYFCFYIGENRCLIFPPCLPLLYLKIQNVCFIKKRSLPPLKKKLYCYHLYYRQSRKIATVFLKPWLRCDAESA